MLIFAFEVYIGTVRGIKWVSLAFHLHCFYLFKYLLNLTYIKQILKIPSKKKGKI